MFCLIIIYNNIYIIKIYNLNFYTTKYFTQNMEIKIKTIAGKDLKLILSPENTIKDLKLMIEDEELIPYQQQRLVCNGKILLKDTNTISESGISNGNVVHMILALRGG